MLMMTAMEVSNHRYFHNFYFRHNKDPMPNQREKLHLARPRDRVRSDIFKVIFECLFELKSSLQELLS